MHYVLEMGILLKEKDGRWKHATGTLVVLWDHEDVLTPQIRWADDIRELVEKSCI